MTQGRDLIGVERDRAVIRGAALSIIRKILEKPISSTKDARKDWLAPPPLMAFKHLEPLGFGLEQDDWWIFSPEDCTPDVVWPLNVGMIADDDLDDTGLAMRMNRWQTVTPKECRGYAHRFGAFMLRSDIAQMYGNELKRAAGLYVWSGGNWTDAQKRVLWEGYVPTRSEFHLKDRDQPRIATGIALRQRYEWAVSLGLEKSPSVRFATDPTGIKDIFRIRDLPEGRDRREALMTWVTDHWRQDRKDSEIEIYVRKHLRGTTKFNWRGMEGEILPSQFDLDQRDKAISDRQAMRVAGVDRRVKIELGVG